MIERSEVGESGEGRGGGAVQRRGEAESRD
jgi:hypothetical protein